MQHHFLSAAGIQPLPPNFSLPLPLVQCHRHSQSKHRPHRRLFFPLETYIRLNTWKSLSIATSESRQDTVFFLSHHTQHSTISTTQASHTEQIHIPYYPVHTYSYLN